MANFALALSALSRCHLWAGYALSGGRSEDNACHAKKALSWLGRAEKSARGEGFAHSLHLARGWLPGYPETSGYILPSIDLAAHRFGVAGMDAVIANTWSWLKRIQRADGSFGDLTGSPQVFDTGQILIGANYMLRQDTPGAAIVAKRAGEWLRDQQSSDGSFVRHAYNARPHSYYSRVGAALLDAGQLLNSAELVDSGARNLEWTLKQQGSDGWFDHMSFSDHPPYSHTIVYTLEGLLAGYRLSGEKRMLDAVVSCATALGKSIAAHGGVVRSQYQVGFLPVDDQICVTGLCQWAALCFRLEHLGIDGFLGEAERSLAKAKSLQLVSPFSALDGALPGSVPLSGRYMRFALPNWGVKFFLDALIEAEGGEDLPPLI